MITQKLQPITALEITEAQALDPIRVILHDIKPGEGRIILECFGQAWSNYWPAMGDNSLARFFVSCDPFYILEKMVHPKDNKKARTYLLRIIITVQQALKTYP